MQCRMKSLKSLNFNDKQNQNIFDSYLIMHSNKAKLTFCFCFIVLFVVVMMSNTQHDTGKNEDSVASIINLYKIQFLLPW